MEQWWVRSYKTMLYRALVFKDSIVNKHKFQIICMCLYLFDPLILMPFKMIFLRKPEECTNEWILHHHISTSIFITYYNVRLSFLSANINTNFTVFTADVTFILSTHTCISIADLGFFSALIKDLLFPLDRDKTLVIISWILRSASDCLKNKSQIVTIETNMNN